MTASEVSSTPSLFDRASSDENSNAAPALTLDAEPVAPEAAAPAPAAAAEDAASSSDGQESAEASASAPPDRKRLAEQLDALKRKEFELRRALAATDHPELAEAIRTIEGRAFGVSRAEGKLAQGFSKSEARRREVIEKKLGALCDKRAELDTQIAKLESELSGLGADRLVAFEQERQEALEQLMLVLGTHAAALNAAGLVPAQLVPEIEAWLPELEAIASKLSSPSAA